MTCKYSGCSSLASVVIPNGVTSIENEAFYECCGLTSVTIGSSVEAIGDNAFYKCTGLTSVVLPDSVKSLGWGTFAYCSGVTSVNIPSSVTSIQYSAFDYCGGLTSLKVEDGNSVYDSRDNCNAIIETATNTLAHGCMNTVIPNDVKAIGYSAFDGCSGLTSIAIPHTVASIGDFAFGGCDNLSSVTVERATPVIIISSTFSNCGNAILYVPYGSKSTYEAADYWKNFKEIIEMEEPNTDISLLDNVIYVEKAEAFVGSDVTLSVKMKNTAAIRGFQFDLYLPEGVTLAKNDKGKFITSLSAARLDEDDEHTLTISQQANGSYRFLCGSMYEETFLGNDGEIATVKLNIAENMEDGDYPMYLRNIKLTENNISKKYETAEVKSTLTISNYTTGDINGDGEVDVSDYIGVANHILGHTPEGFVEKAADVDGDGVIDVSDYIGVANIILTGSIYGSQQQSRISRHGEIE